MSGLLTTLSPSSRPFHPATQYADYSFIAVLALAQRLHISFLPLTWQAALGKLGQGGQAGVNQALINLQTSFAFKLFERHSLSDSDEYTPFQEIVSEMIVLSHPSIREHPHIITLEGICWDIPGDGDQVWPVLVFQKSHFGDLHQFARTGIGRNLSLEERFKLCADIGIAIRDMHSNNIIHGDIKPQNVLIFRDEIEGYFAQVADFGFSTRFRGESDLILMPKSRPWNAPEHHHRGFSPLAAKNMDVYSFGLLCLWLLFGASDQVLLAPWMPQEHEQFISFEGSQEELNLLESLKSDESNKLLKWVAWLVNEEKRVKDGTRNNLNRFFSFTLTYKQGERNLDFDELLKLLNPARTVQQSMETFNVESVQIQENFQIQSSFLEFYEADFRLRSFIATKLEYTASKFPLPLIQHISPQNAAMQLALCYGVGFGVHKDDNKGKKLLEESSQHDKSFEHKVQLMKDAISWSPQQDGLYQRVLQKGHIQSIDFAQYYRERNLLERAELNYKREIKDLQKGFGESHEICLILTSRLASTFWTQGRWKEAEELEVQVIETRKKILGGEHPDTLTSIANLASTFKSEGRWEDAKHLEVHVMEAKKRMLGHEHPHTLISIANFATTSWNQGRWKEAEDLEVKVMETRKRVLGDEHPDTLTSITNLAATYENQGRWKEAEELEVQVMETGLRVLGQEHPFILTSMGNLASTYRNQGRWKEAEKLEVKVMETSIMVLGDEHPDTLTSMANLAATYENQGRWKDAETLEMQVIETRKRMLGDEHPDMLISMANLAATYENQGRWKEAEELEVQVIKTRKRMLGDEHPDTLASIANLASTFRDQGRCKEAEKLEVQVIEMRKSVLGDEHPSTLNSMANLATTFWNQGRWKEAEDLELQVMETRKRMLGDEHPDTLGSMANLATTYENQGRWKEAEELEVQVMETRKRVLGEEHPNTLTIMANLASTFWNQRRWKEAEELEVQVMEMRKRVLGNEHPDTLMSMNKVAKIFKQTLPSLS